MQKLIQLIEAYNDAQHVRTIPNAITSTGTQTVDLVNPSSMKGSYLLTLMMHLMETYKKP